MTAFVVFFVVTRPTPAQAALRRVINAAEKTRTTHLVMWRQLPGSPREVSEGWFSGPLQRIEDTRGGELVSVEVSDAEQVGRYQPGTHVFYTRSREKGADSMADSAVPTLLGKYVGKDVKMGETTFEGRQVDVYTADSRGTGRATGLPRRPGDGIAPQG